MSTSARRTVALADAPETDVDVDLAGRVFTVRAFTRSIQAKVAALEASIDDTNDVDQVAQLTIEMIDAILAPTGEQRKSAKSVLSDLWEHDKLSYSQLLKLAEDIQEAGSDRPT